PPGSNDGPRIAEYRTAVANGPVGPWCAQFASWCARQAGVPLGAAGQGFSSVSDVWAWAQASGRALPAAGTTPQAGDLVVWGRALLRRRPGRQLPGPAERPAR